MAELELLLGQVKGSRANIEPVAALELLQVPCLSLLGKGITQCLAHSHMSTSSSANDEDAMVLERLQALYKYLPGSNDSKCSDDGCTSAAST